MSVFQERLSQIIEEEGVKAVEISRGTGISTSTISKYLSDPNKKAAFDLVLKIASFLDVDPSWLGGLTDERKPFHQPTINEMYDKLSDIGKKQATDYISFLLKNESEQK